MAYTQLYSGLGWGTTFEMNGKKPLIAKRSFPTLDDAYGYVNDLTATGTACPGLIIAVTSDPTAKNNGIYWIESVGVKDADDNLVSGKLVKAGGAETETADKYTDAVELSKDLVVGQLIKVSNDEVVSESANSDSDGDSDSDVVVNTYKAGFYIVDAPGVISALGSSDEIASLEARVDADIAELTSHMTDAAVVLSQVDDRLVALEAFEETHEAIADEDIEGLFATKA